MSLVWVILAGLALFLVGTPIAVLLQSHFARKRWGTLEGPLREVGQGAYRGSVVRTELLRGAPTGMTWASTLAAAWAAVTLGIFVPLGALASIVMIQELARYPERPPTTCALVALIAVFTLSGGALGASMVASCVTLARRHPRSEERALLVSRFCYGHHGALWLAGTLLATTEPQYAVWWSMLLAFPCILGGLAGLALRHAADEALVRTRAELFRSPEPPSEAEAPVG